MSSLLATARFCRTVVDLRHALHADPRRSGDEQDTADAVVDAAGGRG